MRSFVAIPGLVAVAGCEVLGLGGPGPDVIETAASLTCAEVRSGIDAFNDKDYDSTVDHFRQARPFAKRYAELSDEKKADDLLEAIEYYAHLPAEDYADAFRNSRRFLEYKKITLDQCQTGTET